MAFRRRSHEEPEINLVPMIDVLLMTLIFLILTTSFARTTALKIMLPRAHDNQTVSTKGVRILIDAAGDYAVDGVVVAGTESRLTKALEKDAKNRNTPVIIYADRMAPYRCVVNALDAARGLGLDHIVFATKAHKHS